MVKMLQTIDLFGKAVSLRCDPQNLQMKSDCGGIMTIFYCIVLIYYIYTQVAGMFNHQFVTNTRQYTYSDNLDDLEFGGYVGKEFNDTFDVRVGFAAVFKSTDKLLNVKQLEELVKHYKIT